MKIRMISEGHQGNQKDKAYTLVDKIKQINANIQSKDFSYLQHIFNNNDKQLLKQFYYIIQHWNIFKPSLQSIILIFLETLNKKFKTFNQVKAKNPIKQLLFPFLSDLQSQIQKCCKINKIQQNNKMVNTNFNRNKNDEKIIMRCQQKQLKKIKQKFQIDNIKKSNGNKNDHKDKPIDQIKLELNSAQRRLVQKYQANLQYKQFLQNINQASNEQKNPYVYQIQYERLISLKCLGCCQFFYLGLNIYDAQIIQTPLVLLQGIAKLQELQVNFKNQICYLLNNNGGIILFDCKKINEEVIPTGEYFTNVQIAQTQQRIYNYIQSIYPKPMIKHNVELTFVPLIDKPEDSQDKPILKKRIDSTYDINYFQRQFMQGMYVARIKVIPTEGQKCYFWVNEQRPIFPVKNKGDQYISAISSKRICKYIKKKFNSYYIAQNDPRKQELKFQQPRLSHFHKGDCKKPEQGKITSLIKKSKEQQNKSKQFLFMSIILAKKTNLPAIKQNLQNMNIKFQIEYKFQRHKLKAQLISSILHHNNRFDEMLNIFALPQFVFNKKPSSIILVTSLIKLLNRNARNVLPYKVYQDLCIWLKTQFPSQKLRVWYFMNQKNESDIYLQSQSKYSMLLMFYVLNSYNQAAHFRNPPNFDKFTLENLQQRFTLICPKEQSLQTMPLIYVPLMHHKFGVSLNKEDVFTGIQNQEPSYLEQELDCNVEMKRSLYKLEYEQMREEYQEEIEKQEIALILIEETQCNL